MKLAVVDGKASLLAIMKKTDGVKSRRTTPRFRDTMEPSRVAMPTLWGQSRQ